MIRQSRHFTSRIYNRRFAGQVLAIVDSYVAGPIEAAELEEQVFDDEPIVVIDEREQEREDVHITGERNWLEEDYYQRLAEDRYQGYDQRREPDRYGWDQYAGSRRY